MDATRVMSGTWGQVWVDGTLWAEINGFQAKISKNKSDINLCGQMAVDQKVTSTKGTGSISLNKVYTRLSDDGDSIARGHDRRVTIVCRLNDPDAFGAEGCALSNCSFDDETIFDFKAGSAGSTTCPFTFTNREWLDQVTA